MIKYSGIEDSGIRDKVTGKTIQVTTTVRVGFRASDQAWKSVRNIILNKAIASDFSNAKPQSRTFKPKNRVGVGQVRDSGSGRYISIIDESAIRIVYFHGSLPRLQLPYGHQVPAPANIGGAPAPVTMSPAPVKFSNYIIAHANDNLLEQLAEQLNLNTYKVDALVDYLANNTGLERRTILLDLQKNGLDLNMERILDSVPERGHVHDTEMSTVPISDPMYERTGLSSSPFALDVGHARL